LVRHVHALAVYVIALVRSFPFCAIRSQGQLQAIALAILGYLYFGWNVGHLIFSDQRQARL